MTNHHRTLMFEDFVEAEQRYCSLLHADRAYYSGKLEGLRNAVRIIAYHIGKDMKPSETIEDYYKRWRSGYEVKK